MRLGAVITVLAIATAAPAKEGDLIPMTDMSRDALTLQVMLERCSALYKAMSSHGQEANGLPPALLDITDRFGKRAHDIAIENAADENTSRMRIAAYKTAYLRDFRATNTDLRMINSPNPLFQSDRAVCRDLLL